MKLGLNMVVRNEENRIRQCLKQIHHLFDHITIVDTGSTDSTISILENEMGITPLHYAPPKGDKFNIVPARNFGLSHNKSPWILTLDADEIIYTPTVKLLLNYEPEDDVYGLFMRWSDYRFSQPFEDYKLFVFRNDPRLRFLGRVHAVPQSAIREMGKKAEWFEGTVLHLPETKKTEHRDHYTLQIEEGIKENPSWYRYHWFLGYTLYKRGSLEEAKRVLTTITDASPLNFPVETLNAFMILTELESGNKRAQLASNLLLRARRFFELAKDDFEVQVNFRLLSWLDEAESLQRLGETIKAYQFAY